ncbi:hypothetical protein ACFVZW_10445 [Streptomyces sp. NPDC059567]|uniref:hypothetical protein n=1 Tax=Streptomyces sp. NPDC059567 TaxID=3346867 RepID=UPI0036B9B101
MRGPAASDSHAEALLETTALTVAVTVSVKTDGQQPVATPGWGRRTRPGTTDTAPTGPLGHVGPGTGTTVPGARPATAEPGNPSRGATDLDLRSAGGRAEEMRGARRAPRDTDEAPLSRAWPESATMPPPGAPQGPHPKAAPARPDSRNAGDAPHRRTAHEPPPAPARQAGDAPHRQTPPGGGHVPGPPGASGTLHGQSLPWAASAQAAPKAEAPPARQAEEDSPYQQVSPGAPDAPGPLGAVPHPQGAPRSYAAPGVEATEAAPAPVAKSQRRRSADPVKALMHRHRELCERAVDPLEIAAGLEAHGVTDRTAARFRHRDVFSLAEELYARVPRQNGAPPRPLTEGETRSGWAGWTVAALAPGAATALTVIGLALTEGPVRLAVGAAGALGLAAALAVAVRRGPLRAAGRTVPAARVWTLWLLAYAVGGDGLLQQVLTGGPDGAWDITPQPLLGLALAVPPAAWCARFFAARARRRLTASRGLEDFAAGTRPLLLATVALHLTALAGLLGLTGFAPGALALGALLLLARLLTVHGFPETAASGLAAACAAEALAVASVLAGRMPGCDLLAVPVRALVDTWGPGAVPTLVCGAAALGLLAHATAALSRASAHAPTGT